MNPITAHGRDEGRAARHDVPRRMLSELPTGGRDPLAILDAQNATRVPELVPLRAQRMAASAFAFYRGTAALMAADLAAGPSSGIPVASCGDAHVANFGFYASPQRTLVFDLNDFDEAAWAPWEWDLKRLVTSVVIAAQSTGRSEEFTWTIAISCVQAYARALRRRVELSPVERYFQHFDVEGTSAQLDRRSRSVVRKAVRASRRRTGEQAARKLTERADGGRLRFVERPPTMTHIEPDLQESVHGAIEAYAATTRVDIRLLLQQYRASDTVRRVVGVGSVGTRCYLTVLEDDAGHPLLLQTKEAGRSVLAEHGRQPQPDVLVRAVEESGEGARVVALQQVLQGVSDPFLGFMSGRRGHYYVRQFRDMKGGIEIETLEDEPFRQYAAACAVTLARAHAQSPTAAAVAGYVGGGSAAGEAIATWAFAYADLARADYEEFVAAGGAATA